MPKDILQVGPLQRGRISVGARWGLFLGVFSERLAAIEKVERRAYLEIAT